MRIKNKTTIPTSLLEEIITFVRPKKIGYISYDIGNLSNGYFSGSAYYGSKKVFIKIHTKAKYPHLHDVRGKPEVIQFSNKVDENGEMIFQERIVRRNGGYLPSLVLSLEEALVHIIAHELRHFWQSKQKTRRGKVWGSRGSHSERDCDAYAIKMQRKWRRLHNEEDCSNINWLFSIDL